MVSTNDKMAGSGTVVGKLAPNFRLQDHTGGTVTLVEACRNGPVFLAFYPGDFTPVCTKQLCNYRDNIKVFQENGLQLFGVSKNDPASHKMFAEAYDFPFLLLSDPSHNVAKEYGCTSILMLGKVSRAVFIINQKGIILYRYVEPTVLSRRKADEIVKVVEDLKANNLL